MTTKAKMDEFRAIANSRLRLGHVCVYKLWTVGRSQTIHVTCRMFARSVCEYAADELIKKHGGIRYATMVSSVGMLGAAHEAGFCFKLSNKGVDKQ